MTSAPFNPCMPGKLQGVQADAVNQNAHRTKYDVQPVTKEQDKRRAERGQLGDLRQEGRQGRARDLALAVAHARLRARSAQPLGRTVTTQSSAGSTGTVNGTEANSEAGIGTITPASSGKPTQISP